MKKLIFLFVIWVTNVTSTRSSDELPNAPSASHINLLDAPLLEIFLNKEYLELKTIMEKEPIDLLFNELEKFYHIAQHFLYSKKPSNSEKETLNNFINSLGKYMENSVKKHIESGDEEYMQRQRNLLQTQMIFKKDINNLRACCKKTEKCLEFHEIGYIPIQEVLHFLVENFVKEEMRNYIEKHPDFSDSLYAYLHPSSQT